MEYALSLTEYSAKYDVSVSTLRRKIKKSAILNKMVDGKYLLPDMEYRDLTTQNVAPPTQSEVVIAPPQEQATPEINKEYKGEDLEPLLEVKFDENLNSEGIKPNHESISELKSAFRMILSEKEDQITTLKSYVADLQTLNKVLESELERLEGNLEKKKDPIFNIDFE